MNSLMFNNIFVSQSIERSLQPTGEKNVSLCERGTIFTLTFTSDTTDAHAHTIIIKTSILPTADT